MFGYKQTCAHCHFFVKEASSFPSPNPITVDVTRDERARAARGDFSWVQEHWMLKCHFGVWDEGYDFDRTTRPVVIAEADRRDFCFFLYHRPGMLLPAAKILQERQAKAREAARDRRLTLYGLWIAALALLANVYVEVAKELEWWPF